jgi:hypothetical protein
MLHRREESVDIGDAGGAEKILPTMRRADFSLLF